jgi:hypothetical protein
MNGLTTVLLGRACRLFLERAYPEGCHTIPPSAQAFFVLSPEEPLDAVVASPVCHPVKGPGGCVRGYALRLGSAGFPHLKLLVVDQEGTCVFAVDTHDAVSLSADDPDAPRWAQLQTDNRHLKERIERAWESAGLLTFNSLLRRELERK